MSENRHALWWRGLPAFLCVSVGSLFSSEVPCTSRDDPRSPALPVSSPLFQGGTLGGFPSPQRGEGSCEKIDGRDTLLRVRLVKCNTDAEHRVPTNAYLRQNSIFHSFRGAGVGCCERADPPLKAEAFSPPRRGFFTGALYAVWRYPKRSK